MIDIKLDDAQAAVLLSVLGRGIEVFEKMDEYECVSIAIDIYNDVYEKMWMKRNS